MIENKILLFMGLGNLIISVICFISLCYKKEKSKGLLLLIFMLICPIIGPCYLVVSWFMKKLFFTKDISMDDLSFHTEKLEMIVGPDFDKEINIVPVEEALIISDVDNKRRVILDVLKEDYDNSLTVITDALENEDSETSHYVATIIADVKSNFKVTVQKMQDKLNQFPGDSEISILLIDYIDSFLEKKVLSELEMRTYVEQYVELMEQLYLNQKDCITGKMCKQIIKHLMNIGKKDSALLWAERAIVDCPNELDSYKGILKLYFNIGDRDKFFEMLLRLKESNIVFDNESIELVRFYQV